MSRAHFPKASLSNTSDSEKTMHRPQEGRPGRLPFHLAQRVEAQPVPARHKPRRDNRQRQRGQDPSGYYVEEYDESGAYASQGCMPDRGPTFRRTADESWHLSRPFIIEQAFQFWASIDHLPIERAQQRASAVEATALAEMQRSSLQCQLCVQNHQQVLFITHDCCFKAYFLS